MEIDRDYEVFISYRHLQCNELAEALYNEFQNRYSVNSFRDNEELHFGDFRKQLIINNLRSQCLVLLLTPGMLDRCHESNDWITKEISLFLKLHKPIIPVKMNGFQYPDNLPDKIKGLLKHDKNSIECDFYDPGATAVQIAGMVYEKLRKGWDRDERYEAIRYKPYLSRHNTEIGGYFYDSALGFRKYVFLFALQLIILFACISMGFHKTETGWSMGHNEYAPMIFGMLSLYLIYFDRKKVDHPTLNTDVSFVDILLDHSIFEAIKMVYKGFLIWAIPFAMILLAVPFAGYLISSFITSSQTNGVAGVDMWYITMFYVGTCLPSLRLAYKTLIATVHFVNSVFGRYPKNFRRFIFLEKAQRVVLITSRILVVPAIIMCGVLASLTYGGQL